MRPARLAPFVLALLVLTGMLLVRAAPASALSCKDPSSVYERYPRAFTGRITDAQKGTIDVEVEEIWKGGPLPSSLTLTTELDGWWDLGGGSIPDGYQSTGTWLFVPEKRANGTMVVNPCSAWSSTKPWGSDLRPANVMPPLNQADASEPAAEVVELDPLPADPVETAIWVAWVAGGVTLLAAAAVLAFALRRNRAAAD